MKKFTFTIACLAVLASFAHSEVKWKRDLNAAVKQAKASKQLIFVDFYADW
jgi:thiol:disulfide interchange protein